MDIFAKYGRDESGNKWPSVDGEVEYGEELLELLILLRPHKLLTTKGWYTRFDSSRAQGNNEQTQKRKLP